MNALKDLRDHPGAGPSGAAPFQDDICWICGTRALVERKCKVICRNCGTMLRSCADL